MGIENEIANLRKLGHVSAAVITRPANVTAYTATDVVGGAANSEVYNVILHATDS